MEQANTGSQNAAPKHSNTRVPSTSSSPPPPPPAYSPRSQPDLAVLTARVAHTQGQFSSTILQAPYSDLAYSAASDQDDEPSSSSSPIRLRINTAVNVSRSNNIVCLNATPAEQASAIGRAVVQALHDSSSGQCGIPMIDEQGCPRPLEIEVEAGLVVEGSGNIVGSRELVNEVIRRHQGEISPVGLRRRSRDDDGEDEQASSAKRRRSSQ